MHKLHIYGALKAYKTPPFARFHMPGHKANARRFPFAGAAADITELSFSDCLEAPDGIIAAAQSEIAHALGAAFSHILTDGSSCGVFAMLYAAHVRKVVAARNSHKSVYHACAVLGIEPILLRNPCKDGVLLPPTAADVAAALQTAGNDCAVLLTSPDYFGNVADLAGIRAVCEGFGVPLLVDGAHGAYLRFDAAAPGVYAGCHADLWVDGSHKTMPTLTQGALLNGRDARFAAAVREGLNIFRTTSPSYPIMASVEYGVQYMAQRGASLIAARRKDLARARQILQKFGLFAYDGQTLSLAVDFGRAGIAPRAVQRRLEACGIYAEAEDGRYLLFYGSPLLPQGAFARLARRIGRIVRDPALQGTAELRAEEPVYGQPAYGYAVALGAKRALVPLAESAGRIAACNAGITPPCCPSVVAGERITAEVAAALAQAEHVFGLQDGKIAVVLEL